MDSRSASTASRAPWRRHDPRAALLALLGGLLTFVVSTAETGARNTDSNDGVSSRRGPDARIPNRPAVATSAAGCRPKRRNRRKRRKSRRRARRCPGGTSRCGALCVDTASDVGNCGGCGAACAAGQACRGDVHLQRGALRRLLRRHDLLSPDPGGAVRHGCRVLHRLHRRPYLRERELRLSRGTDLLRRYLRRPADEPEPLWRVRPRLCPGRDLPGRRLWRRLWHGFCPATGNTPDCCGAPAEPSTHVNPFGTCGRTA